MTLLQKLHPFFFLIGLISPGLACLQNQNHTTPVSGATATPDTIPRQHKLTVEPLTEDQVTDSIYALPEVKERAKYIEEQTAGKRHLVIWVEEAPNADHAYFQVKAGEDNGDEIVTHFHFMVYSSPFRINYYDPVEDKEMTLSEWRQQKK